MIKPFPFLIAPLSMAFFGYLSFTQKGILCYSTFIYAYACIPIIELLMKNDESYALAAEKALAKKSIPYDVILYMSVATQIALLALFLFSLQDPSLVPFDIVGRILSMGLLTTFAINLGHELGHHDSLKDQFLAKMMLLTSLMMHFFIEHNRGHHKNVATLEDPSTARKNESVYAFWIRAISHEYISAWYLEKKKMKILGLPNISFRNEMIQFHFIQATFLWVIIYFFGWQICLYFVASSVIAYVSFETVQYIEHYGLLRDQNTKGRYERVEVHHSWNSNHVFGRLMMFNLSRHSDHHFRPAKKYQKLNHQSRAPQLPTGYPGMMILSLLPPLWFRLMNKRIKRYQEQFSVES
tara:strand:+ start:250 stop:1308 length:1059 start_codon:yes stop_codon:yes gene_type:complete